MRATNDDRDKMPADMGEQMHLQELMAYAAQSELLAHWQPVRYLNSGTFAYIFLVQHRENGSQAVLKFIPNPKDLLDCRERDSQEDLFYQARFAAAWHEAEIMQRFRGESHVMQFLGEPERLERSFTDRHGKLVHQYAVLICMPCCRNHTEWLPLVANDRAARLRMGIEVADALTAFERQGVYHRDIKPGNILMDDQGRFVLSDVGEAKLENDFTTTGFHGTRSYMAPEVYNQERAWQKMHSDHRSDIYSLGIILYRLFNSGQFPFLRGSGELTEDARTSFNSYVKRYGDEGGFSRMSDGERASLLRYDGVALPPPCEADPQLAQVILKACAFRLEDRYATAAELKADLICCLQGKPLSQRRAGRGQPSPQTGPRRGRLIGLVAGACALVAAVATGVTLLLTGGSEPPPPPAETMAVMSDAPAPTATAGRFAYSVRTGDDGEQYISITGYTGPVDEGIVIPAEIAGLPVREIAADAFRNRFDLTGTLTIPDSVTTIGQHAFQGCEGLTGTLTIPEGVVTIGDQAFYDCEGLTGSLTIPGSVQSIGKYAFFGCNELNGTLTIRPGVTSIGSGAFMDCWNLTGSLVIPEGITSIGDYTFADCKAMTGALSIPEGVTSIGESAFADCAGLTGPLTLPGSITYIGYNAFENCSGLTGPLVIPEGTVTLGDGAFNGCAGLTGSVTIPEGVVTLGDWVFLGCEGLTGTLTIPAGVAVIGESFLTSTRFTDIIDHSGLLDVPEETPTPEPDSLANGAMPTDDGRLIDPTPVPAPAADATQFDYVVETGEDGERYVSITGYHGPTDAGLNIPAEVEGLPVRKIAEQAFYCRADLKGTLTIPDSVMTIGDDAFSVCSGLTGDLIIPDSVTTIGDWAFARCSGLTGELRLSENVTTIGPFAFFRCYGFTGDLAIPGSVTSIGWWAFDGCAGFDGTLTIPSSVTEIEFGAFPNYAFTEIIDHSGLLHDDLKVRIAPTPSQFHYSIDADSDGNDYIVITGYHGPSDAGLNIPAEIGGIPVREIMEEAFYLRDDLTGNLTIPEGVTTIGASAFERCSALNGMLIIPDNVTTIGEDAFSECTGLTGELRIPEGVTKISSSAFFNCQGLTGELRIPEGVTRIGSGAFRNCAGLTGDLTIPDGVTSIGNSAFASCTGLTGTLTIPASVTVIEEGAFKDCAFADIIDHSGLLDVPETTPTPEPDSLANGAMPTDDGRLIDPPPELAPAADATQFDYVAETGEDGKKYISITGYHGPTDAGLNIPAEVEGLPVREIGKKAFSLQENLTGQLILPDSVTVIGSWAFYECDGLTGQLILPADVTAIGAHAFQNCTGLTGQLILPAGVTSIGTQAFSGCEGLTGPLILPDGMPSVPYGAFQNCTGLTGDLTIPDGVTDIGEYAFAGCTGLTGTLTIPASVTSIADNAFEDCAFTGIIDPSGLVDMPVDAGKADESLSATAAGFAGGEVSVSVTVDGAGKIRQLVIDASTQTEHIGTRVMEEPDFAEQFIGQNGPFVIGENIDALSSATISSMAVVEAVNKALGFTKIIDPSGLVDMQPSATVDWPSLSEDGYCEFIALQKMDVYRDEACSTRGTCSPARSYDAYIARNDVCRITKITQDCVEVQYPTSSGYYAGYVRLSDVFSVTAPTEVVTSAGKTSTYKSAGGNTWGSIEKGTRVFAVGTSGKYTAVIYEAASGDRAYRLAYVPTSQYEETVAGR